MSILEIHLVAAAVERLHLLLPLHELLHGQLQEIAESENDHCRQNERCAACPEWLCVSNEKDYGNEQQHDGHDGCYWLVGAEGKTELNMCKTSEARLSMNRLLAISSRQIMCFDKNFIKKKGNDNHKCVRLTRNKFGKALVALTN
uniref:Uncharacterized protein n=1 Tax=Bactrocera dorsalis TaxID=27457 RepID=A0A034VT56_BACDO